MLPFILGGAALAGIAKVAYAYATRPKPNVSYTPALTTLELNLRRLRRELAGGSGLAIAILGQPGAGKSSLLLEVGGRTLKPKPLIGIETDATDWSTTGDCVLLHLWEHGRVADVPGYDTQGHPVATFLSDFPFASFGAFIFVVRGKLRAADERIYRRLAETGKPLLVVRGFADGMNDAEVLAAIDDIRTRLHLPESAKVLPLSNRTGAGIRALRRWMREQTK